MARWPFGSQNMISDKMKSRLCKAIRERDAGIIGVLVDQLRFGFGLNYEQTYLLAFELVGITRADWDALLYEADLEESSL